MSDRIDHSARANNLLTPAGALGTVDAINDKRIAAAQVHAMLALVEQQRIANRIALAGAVAESARHNGSPGFVLDLIVKDFGLFRYPRTSGGVPPLDDDIREGLGLS
jgi:glutaminase